MLKEQLIELVKPFANTDVEIIDGGRFADYAIAPNQRDKFDVWGEELADNLSKAIPESLATIKHEAGFINFSISQEAIAAEANSMLKDFNRYQQIPDKHKVVIDYSGPNIAKPFSVGHLRSTVIGQANYNIHKALGHEVVGINHIGDWGTQFGKLIYAIKTWGNEEDIVKSPIENLNSLYVKFHDEAEKEPELEDKAREWSKKLEEGDEEARRLWKQCIEWSFAEFNRIYEILGVKIDNVVGESFYEDKLQAIVDELNEKDLLTESQGAKVVMLDDLPPALIIRKDGATLYMTRDLAALKYRINTYNPQEIIYHVGQDQSLHFRQLKAIAEKLGWLDDVRFIFAGHGLMRLPEGKMSTRKGRVILLEDLIKESEKRVSALLEEKNAQDAERKVTALGVSAIKYADLSVNRHSDVVFSFEKMIDLKGNSAIYLQYAYARMSSLINEYEKKAGKPDSYNFNSNSDELLRDGLKYKEILIRSSERSEPHLIADFANNFTNKFNAFYEKNRILTSDDKEADNMSAVYFSKLILGECIDLLALAKFERL